MTAAVAFQAKQSPQHQSYALDYGSSQAHKLAGRTAHVNHLSTNFGRYMSEPKRSETNRKENVI